MVNPLVHTSCSRGKKIFYVESMNKLYYSNGGNIKKEHQNASFN